MFEQQVRQIPFYFVVFLVLMLAFLGIVASSMLGPAPVPPQPALVGGDPNPSSDIVAYANEPVRKISPLEQSRQELGRALTVTGDRLEEVQSSLGSFTVELKSLQDNDAGKRIVGSNEHFPQLVALIRYAPDLDVSLNQASARYSALVSREVASTSESELKSVKLSLNDFDTQVSSLEQDVENAKLALNAISTVCQKLPQATMTVRTRLHADEEKEKLSYAQKLKESQDSAKREQEQKLQLADKERSDAKASLEAATKRLEALRLRQQAANVEGSSSSILSGGRAAQDTALLEADYRRDLSEINRLLSPLMSQGHKQPEHAGYQRRAREVGPMSLSALRSCGALEPTDKGLEDLAFAMTYDNDRSSSGFPQYIGGGLQEEHYRYVVPAQKLLLKYQYLLVEKKRLAE